MKNNKTNRPVLVTTEFRGVFFGYVKDDSKAPGEITLTNVRNCIYWSAEVKGFLGLAVHGPNKSCKIGASAPEMTLYKLTGYGPVTEMAEVAWTSA